LHPQTAASLKPTAGGAARNLAVVTAGIQRRRAKAAAVDVELVAAGLRRLCADQIIFRNISKQLMIC